MLSRGFQAVSVVRRWWEALAAGRWQRACQASSAPLHALGRAWPLESLTELHTTLMTHMGELTDARDLMLDPQAVSPLLHVAVFGRLVRPSDTILVTTHANGHALGWVAEHRVRSIFRMETLQLVLGRLQTTPAPQNAVETIAWVRAAATEQRRA